MNIAGLDKAAVLAALYNRARPLGMGFLHYTPEPMSVDEARAILADHKRAKAQPYFDYVKGRVMKIMLEGDEIRVELYDRDNGEGSAEAAIAHLRGPVTKEIT